jgi:MocE subfamily Rieske [2Fe-2S] domain protein
MALAASDDPARDYSLTGPERDRAVERGLVAADWYHSDIPHKDMKALMSRSDQPAIRDTSGAVFCTDGLCTHEQVHLADGLVMDDTIECPRHNGRFNYKTGAALRTPACVALATYPARLNAGRIEVQV